MGSKVKINCGEKYGHLTAINFSHISELGHQMWVFECDCENHTRCVIAASKVLSGHVKTCGCSRKISNNRKHNLSHTKLYNTYYKMRERCEHKKCPAYKNYGGRGITVCDEWKTGFDAFLKWANESGYSDELTLDRIDVNKGYSPQNCRWVDFVTQQNNRRNNRLISFNGETHTVSEWSRITNISPYTLYERLKRGWTVEKTLSLPLKGEKKA